MAQRPDGNPARTERVTFTRPAAERIGRVVRIVEAGDRDAGGIGFGVRLQGASGNPIKVCTFTGAWIINSSKTLTFQGSTATVAATNKLFTVGDACETQVAYIGRVDGNWHLLNVQHHETAVITTVALTTASLDFTRRLVWVPYPGETATISIALSTDTSCSS